MTEGEYKEWFAKADADEYSIKILLKGKGSPETITFLSHQVAEKYLKGFLVYNGKDYPRIHQIEKLISLCAEIEPGFKDLIEQGVLLSEFYLESRYPGTYAEVTWEEAQSAFAVATRIRNLVLAKSR